MPKTVKELQQHSHKGIIFKTLNFSFSISSNIQDFSSSWRDGLGFCALLHSQNPDIINFDQLKGHNHLQNLQLAFDTAENKYGINKLLDPEDICCQPDARSIMTYIALTYHTFSKLNQGQKGAKRINNIIQRIYMVDLLKNEYKAMSEHFLAWVEMKTRIMMEREFSNQIEGLKEDLKQINLYLWKEKPDKYQEKVEIETKFFSIMANLRNLNQDPFIAKVRPQDIESKWTVLEREENARKAAIKFELLRQEKLQLSATNFRKKAHLRSIYIDEMSVILEDPRYGTNIKQIQASLKKHEAISADIKTRTSRLNALTKIADFLEKEDFHDKESIIAIHTSVLNRWEKLLNLAESQRVKLEEYSKVSRLTSDLDVINENLEMLQNALLKEQSLTIPTDEKIQKNNLVMTELGLALTSLDKIEKHGCQWRVNDLFGLQRDIQATRAKLKSLEELCKGQQKQLETSHMLERLNFDIEEVHLWIYEKFKVSDLEITAWNQKAIDRLKENQKSFENEVKKWTLKYEKIKDLLSSFDDTKITDITTKITAINADLCHLKKICERRGIEIRQLSELFQLEVEVSVLEPWLRGLHVILNSEEYGIDSQTCNALQKRLNECEEQLCQFEVELDKCSDTVIEFIERAYQQPKSVQREKIQEKKVPQIQAMYAFSGNEISMKKGEIMFLIAKNNSDWWSARKTDGEIGFVPRSYVKEIEPKAILVQVLDSQKSWLHDAIKKADLELRVKLLHDGLKSLKIMFEDRAININNHLQLFEYEYECAKANDWMKTHTQVIKEDKVNPTLRSNIENYENKITEIEGKYKFIRDVFPRNVHDIDKKWLHVGKNWRNLRKECDVAEKMYIDKSEAFRLSQEYDEIALWALAKDQELDNLTKFHNTDDNRYRKLEVFGRELKLLQDRVLGIVPKLHKSDKHMDLHSQLTNLMTRYENEIGRTKRQIESHELDKLIHSFGQWIQISNERIKVGIECQDKDRKHMILRELQEDFKDRQHLVTLLTEKAIGANDKESCTAVLEELHQLVSNMERLDHILVVADKLGRLNDEHRVLVGTLMKIESALSHDPDIEAPASDLDLKMKTVKHKVYNFKDASTAFLKNSICEGHDESDNLAQKIEELNIRWIQLKDMHEKFQSKATVKRSLIEFETANADIIAFTEQKLNLVKDTSFKGEQNLKHKLKIHEVLENEIRVYASHIKLHNLIGGKLIKRHSILEETVQKLLEATNALWDELLDHSTKKAKLLKKAMKSFIQQHFLESFDMELKELMTFMITTEEPLNRSDCQKKITNLKVKNNILKRALEKVTNAPFDNVNTEEVECLKKKIDGLAFQLQDKIAHLQKYNLFLTHILRLEFENQWLEEKKIVLNNCILAVGEDGHEVRAKNISDEITGHLPNIFKLIEEKKKWHGFCTSRFYLENVVDLVESNLKLILSHQRELEEKREKMKKLKDIHNDVINVESWCEEKKSLLLSKKYSLNEAHIVSNLKRLKMIELELDCYVGISREAQTQMKSLSQISPFLDKEEEIMLLSNNVCGELDDIKTISEERRSDLMFLLQYLELVREVEAMNQWTISKTSVLRKILNNVSNNTNTLDMTFHSFTQFKSSITQGEAMHDLCHDLAKRLKKHKFGSQYEISNSSIDEHVQQIAIEWISFQSFVEESEIFLSRLNEVEQIRLGLTETLATLKNKIEFLSSETGKSKEKTIETSMRRQREFELELAGHEEQIAKFDAETLKIESALGADVSDLHNEVKSKWLQLLEMSKVYREELLFTQDYLDFCKLCEEIRHWVNQITAQFPEFEGSYTIQHAQNLRNDLETYRHEIETKEVLFKEILERCSKMESYGNPNGKRSSKKLETLMEARQNLHMSWQQKKVHVDQIIDYNFFQRDVRKINGYFSAIEAKISNFRPLNDITNIISDINNIKVIENHVKLHSDKLHHLQSQAKKLVKQNHINAQQISTSMTKTNEYVSHVRQNVEARGKQLQNFQLCVNFHSSIDERIDWIEYKINAYKQAWSQNIQDCNWSEKEDILKKFLSFGADISHSAQEIEELTKKGKILLSSGIPDEGLVQLKLINLDKAWQMFQQVTYSVEDGLCHVSEMQNVEKQLTNIEAVFRHSAYMLSTHGTGSDLEHCCYIQSNLKIQCKEHVSQIHALDDFQKRIHSKEFPQSVQKRIDLNMDMAKGLQIEFNIYEAELKKAEFLHTMCHGICENSDNVKEKIAYLKSVKGVSEEEADLSNKICIGSKITQIRKHMENIGQAISVYSKELSNMPKSNLKGIAENQLESLSNIYDEGLDLCHQKLEEVTKYQNLVSLYNNLYASKTTLEKMISNVQKLSLAERENEIEHGFIIISDTRGQCKSYDIKNSIHQAAQYPKSKAINDLAAEVKKLDCDLNIACNDAKNHLLGQTKIHFHQRKILDIKSWIIECQTRVPNTYGSSPKETQTFRRQIVGQLAELHAKMEMVKLMKVEVADNKTEGIGIETSNSLEQLESALLMLEESMQSKSITLSQVETCHLLLRKMSQLRNKIDEKWQTAIDDNFSDLINIPIKQKQHEQFSKMVISDFQQVVTDLEKEATSFSNEVINKGNIDTSLTNEIQKETSNIVKQWDLLGDQLTMKRERLEEANFAAHFINKSNEVEQVLLTTEKVMEKELPQDIVTAKEQLKHCNIIKGKIDESKKVLDNLDAMLKTISEHFMLAHLSSVQQRNKNNMENSLSEMTKFLSTLIDNLSYLEFSQKVQVRILWISEKMQQVTIKKDKVTGLAAIESMLRHHKLLEIEVGNHSEECRAMANIGQTMVLEGNIMSNQIESELLQMSKLGNELDEKMHERKKQLDHALAFEHFQLDCNELLTWVQEKDLILEQNGNTDDKLFDIRHSKVVALSKEIMQQQNQILLIAKQQEFLVSLAHVREDAIEGMYNTLLEAFNRLSFNAKKTESNMAIYSKYLGFLHDFDNIQHKINNQLSIASSEDYGKDLIQVQELQKIFEGSLEDNKIIAREFMEFKEYSKELFNINNYGSKIYDQVQALEGLWNDTEELSLARKEALFGAKVIHTFDKTVTEVSQLLGEKGAILDHMITCDGDDLDAFSDMLDKVKIGDLETKVSINHITYILGFDIIVAGL